MKQLRVYWRLTALLVSMGAYLSVIAGKQILLGEDEHFALRIRQKWTRLALRILGLRVEVNGTIPQVPGLVVANHKCLIDPVIVLSQLVAIPVGKAEIARYPLVGKAAQMTGILFLERKNKDSHLATREGIRRVLQKELSILIFPEGTTFSKPWLRDFKKGSFEIAAEEGIGVIPIAIQYGHEDMIWQEGLSTWQHFNRCFSLPSTSVVVHAGPLINDLPSRELLTQSRAFILEALNQKDVQPSTRLSDRA